MRYLISLTLILILSHALPTAAEPTRVAVVEGQEHKDIATLVSAVLQEELSRSGKFTLIERSRLKEVIEEITFQQSGVTDTDTAVEIGKHLNVELLFFVQIHRIHPEYAATLKIVDVSTNQVLRVEEKALGGNKPAFGDSTRKLARHLLQLSSLLSPSSMVLFPIGAFNMGSNRGLGDEAPVHPVAVNAFYIDRHEVSRIAYHEYLRSQNRASESTLTDPEHPVTQISWNDAEAYCRWLGKRLPTEAEWEYAARGSTGRPYPWGKERPSRTRARFGGQFKGPIAVDALPQGATPEGLYHMVGNAAEWVQDWWGPYPDGKTKNPAGPEDGDYKVVRGGSWSQPADELRSTVRAYHNPDRGAAYIGLRCARDASPTAP